MNQSTSLHRKSRVEAGCDAKGISVAELAKRIHRPRQFLYAVLSGNKPGTGMWEDLARELGCAVEWLTTGFGPHPSWWRHVDSRSDAVNLLTRQKQQGTQNSELEPNESHDSFFIEIIDRSRELMGTFSGDSKGDFPYIKVSKKWKAIEIHDAGGKPIVWPGQTVLVDPDAELEKDCVVVVEGDSGPVIKRFVEISDDKIFLASINSGIDSMVANIDDLPYRPLVVVGVLWLNTKESNK